jgi:hypothetical protein
MRTALREPVEQVAERGAAFLPDARSVMQETAWRVRSGHDRGTSNRTAHMPALDRKASPSLR